MISLTMVTMEEEEQDDCNVGSDEEDQEIESPNKTINEID